MGRNYTVESPDNSTEKERTNNLMQIGLSPLLQKVKKHKEIKEDGKIVKKGTNQLEKQILEGENW